MISLFGGRLTLTYDRPSHQWMADIRLGSQPEYQISLPTNERDAHKALKYGLSFYETFSAKVRSELEAAGAVMCWDCLHWEPPGRGRCGLSIPEARKTGGRFAAGCALFTPCPGLKSSAN